MKHAYFTRRGMALSLALALGVSGVPFSGALQAHAAVPVVLSEFNFDDGISGWSYGSGWEWEYSSGAATSVSSDNGRLKFDVDYSADKDKGWSQVTAVWEPSDGKGMNLTGATNATLDFFYDTSKMSIGSFSVKVYCNEGLDANAVVDATLAETVSGTIKKVPVEISFDALSSKASDVKQFALQVVGRTTGYKGSVWIDNLTLTVGSLNDPSIDSTVRVRTSKPVKISGSDLITYKKDGSTQKTKLTKNVALADKKATDEAKRLYTYLKAVGASDSVIFGHQNDTSHKAGNTISLIQM